MCGEHPFRAGVHAAVRGSSPRVRGTRRGDAHAPHRPGIIPACAGNTRTRPGWRRSAGDHPRVCGEHISRPLLFWMSMGSSPRVRGTHMIKHGFVYVTGIIPACAGNTRRSGRLRPTRRGSSPRVRGTPINAPVVEIHCGIIPACAGNTRAPTALTQSRRDHPRVCGEHPKSSTNACRSSGSSPRVRGTPARPRRRRRDQGIIPACAGNTRPTSFRKPRRAWIIPACAGNTRGLQSGTLLVQDHPRVCGEHRYVRPACECVPGSSPRVRGTH